jgi:ATP-binding cassette, subfamily B, bacterial CvaB/MchF/RaxB
MLNFSGRRALPVIMQSEASECGLACLAMVASYYGHRIDLSTLRRQHPISLNGVTLRSVIEIARHMNFTTRAVRLEPDDLKRITRPAILHWDMNHFVVLKSVSKRGIVLHDPALGEKRVSWSEVSKHLTGVALELTPTESFERKDERARLRLSTFLRQASGAKHALLQILALSFALELLVIAGPFYLQLAVDEVVARGDVDLLVVLALGFALVAALTVAVTWLRSLIVVILQNTLHFAFGARLFRHLIRLPLSFFEKRHIGDVLSRFTSIEPVRDLISESLILALIDGTMALITLTVMFFYSAKLALIVVGAFLCYAVIRIALFRYLRDLSERMIQAKANETSNFVESLRAMQSIKLFNHENEREGQWLNRFAETVNADVRLERAKIGFHAANGVLFGAENILVIYLAAQLALDNVFTIGMVFAFITYKQQFLDKANNLLEKALDFGIVGLHLERLSDIALTPLEAGHDKPLLTRPVRGGVEVRDVSFRYSETEDFVLENVNFAIGPGEAATIMGPSGCGKTTLMKIMLGLLQPTSGEVFIDGIPLRTLGVRPYRDQVAAVMQDDQLLSGTIADNICFFANSRDEELMRECARMAGIHDDILRMPMAYNSLIGDMGNSLSGGQRQRVILARARYRRPKILFLDEATAHLDSAKEREISRVLQDLKITRISIAHRSELAEAADVMLRFEGPDSETSIPAQSRAIVPGPASEARRSLASTPAG